MDDDNLDVRNWIPTELSTTVTESDSFNGTYNTTNTGLYPSPTEASSLRYNLTTSIFLM